MDLFCGAMVTVLFVLLAVPGLLVSLALGTAGSAGDPSEVEQLLVASGRDVAWDKVDPRIKAGPAVSFEGRRLTEITVPRFAPFTETLIRLAQSGEDLELLSMTGTSGSIAIKVLADEAALAGLGALPCSVEWTFRSGYASTAAYYAKQQRLHVVLRAEIPRLLEVLRGLSAMPGIHLQPFPEAQVYCFFT